MAAKVGIAAIKVHHFLCLALEASRPVQLVGQLWQLFSEGELFGVVLSFAGTLLVPIWINHEIKLMLFVFQVLLILLYGLYDKVKLSVTYKARYSR